MHAHANLKDDERHIANIFLSIWVVLRRQ